MRTDIKDGIERDGYRRDGGEQSRSVRIAGNIAEKAQGDGRQNSLQMTHRASERHRATATV